MKKKMTRVSTAVLTASMITVLGAAPAFATTPEELSGVCGGGSEAITSVPITKTVTTDGHTYAPATSFAFTVSNGAAGTYDGNVVDAGVTGGLTISGTASFDPSDFEMSDSYSSNASSVTVDASRFTKPGVYHYVITETEGSYEGITYDSSSYDVYVYVYNSSTGNSLYVGNVVSVKGETKCDLVFTNDYGKTCDTTHDVIITKKIAGNAAYNQDKFDFAVSVDGAEGEWYQVIVKESADSEETEYHLVSGADPVTYAIGDGGSIHIYGLSASDVYTVNEADYSGDGYVTTNGENSGTLTQDGTSITVTNTKNNTVPTGVARMVTPFAAMVAAALCGLFFLFKRRSREF